MRRTTSRAATIAVGALTAAALWWRRHPSACPYNQRFWVQAPHPFITRARLREALGDVRDKRVLEVGPGTGYYTLPVAGWIGDAGRLDVFDVQQEMLDHTMRRATARGLANVHATRGDARALPYDDGTFDAAFLVTVLGEIPDQVQALRELRRVLEPDGRLVVGELWGDPHVVPAGVLVDRPGTSHPKRRPLDVVMRCPRSGQWRCHCSLPASLPDDARVTPFPAQRSRTTH